MKKVISVLCIGATLLFAQTPSQTVTINNNQNQTNATQGVPITPENIHIALAQLAMATNSTLPQRLDFVTIFDRATSKGNILKYYYILNDDEDFVLSKFNKTKKNEFLNNIKTNVKNSLCAAGMSQNLLKAGATFNYNFELRNGNKYFEFSMDQSICE